MDKAAPLLRLSTLADSGDFRVGSLRVSPSRRLLEGSAGAAYLQPQVMLVFLCLAEQEGVVVPRHRLFDRCWGMAPVGDDSINRAITSIRQALEGTGADDLSIETIPRTGYRLVATQRELSDESEDYAPVVQAAHDCWRLGWPRPDVAEITALADFLAHWPSDSRGWGVLALLLRKAAEYASAADCAGFVSRCEMAARKAFGLDPQEPNARVALAGLTPLFGNWTTVRRELLEVLESFPDHAPALHDLLFLEMATGRPSVALPILERLLAQDRFAATFYYKGIYQLWTADRLHDAEQVAARAMALWPRHPASWLARFWTLVGTGRADQALRLIADEECRPALPETTLTFLEQTATLVAARDRGDPAGEQISAHAAEAVELASFGPANAIASLQALCALGAIDQAFEVAYGYYLGQGGAGVPLRWNASDPSVTDQYRRVTQLLFIPLAAPMREHPRFLTLCDDTGLTAYWNHHGMTPDFLASTVSHRV